MIIPKLRELGEAIVSLFSKPVTSKYPFTKKPYEPVKQFKGKPIFNEEECIGCGACAQVCPASAIDLTDIPEEGKRILQVNYTSCIYCGQCEEHCITQKGIQLSNEYITATFSPDKEADFMRIEKKTHCLSGLWNNDRYGRSHELAGRKIRTQSLWLILILLAFIQLR